MAITRAQIVRELRRQGGIMGSNGGSMLVTQQEMEVDLVTMDLMQVLVTTITKTLQQILMQEVVAAVQMMTLQERDQL